MSFFAMGAGIGTQNDKNEWLEVFFPSPLFKPSFALIEKVSSIVGYQGGNAVIELDSPTCHALEALFMKEGMKVVTRSLAVLECSSQPKVLVILENDIKAMSTPEVYLKLHLLSHRMVKPHEINLEGIFAKLPNVAWTSQGAIDIGEVAERQILARARGELLSVYSVDKFPRMTDYVIPKGVRIADTARVRLGAYLGEGTTIMHEGFVNFNAGTMGPNMIEGRISAGVMVGEGSDLGGGCSTMGTLSGGNSTIISVGKNCLIGANAGTGISLGNNCTIEAGLYITAGAKVTLMDERGKVISEVAARHLSGKDNLLFRRHSKSGAIECLGNNSAIELNDVLHSHN